MVLFIDVPNIVHLNYWTNEKARSKGIFPAAFINFLKISGILLPIGGANFKTMRR
jgi:hypothetical protein